MNKDVKQPTPYEKLHWWVFNFIAKLFGLIMIIWSAIFAYSFITDLLENSGQWYGLSPLETVFAVLACIFFLVIGVAILKAKKYFPKDYSEYYNSNK